MSNEIALSNLKINLPAQLVDEMDSYDDVAKGSDFLPRLQLITKGKYVDKGKIAPGHWGVPLTGEEITDLGTKIDIIPLVYRPKAMDVSNPAMIIVSFDKDSDEFKRIVSAKKKPGQTSTGCIWGPTFLVYERSTAKFYELFMSNKSGRTEAPKMRPFLLVSTGGVPTPASISIRYKEKGSNGWHVPDISKCTMPFEVVPTQEEIEAQIAKFMELKSGVERATQEEEETQTRAR